jgi:Tfp pilus assembly protein PilN
MARISKIQLDFLHPTGRGSPIARLLLAAGVLAALAVLTHQRQVSIEVRSRESQLEEMRGMSRRALPAITGRESDNAETRDQIKKANLVLAQMNVPWEGLFAAIESAEDGNVALLAVQPDVRGRGLLIGGQARSLPAVLNYMARLQRSERLRNVVLATHEIKAKEPGQPVEFSLLANWVEAP